MPPKPRHPSPRPWHRRRWRACTAWWWTTTPSFSITTGAEAIARLGTGDLHFDAVLCDLQLAGDDDGMDVITAAKRLQPDALAVLVSGATGPEVLQRLRHGGVMLLTKPVAPAKLRALLSTRRHAASPA